VSTNAKNEIKPAFLRNFTTNIACRNIVIENPATLEDFQKLTKQASEKTNLIVQELNTKIHSRQLPYVTLTPEVNTVNRELSLREKQNFNGKKYKYYSEGGFDCYYQYENNNDVYYSFAFSARSRGNDRLDTDKYIRLWNSFIESTYPSSIHKVESVYEQLKQHEEYGQLSTAHWPLPR